jgi:hypothetical protein
MQPRNRTCDGDTRSLAGKHHTLTLAPDDPATLLLLRLMSSVTAHYLVVRCIDTLARVSPIPARRALSQKTLRIHKFITKTGAHFARSIDGRERAIL